MQFFFPSFIDKWRDSERVGDLKYYCSGGSEVQIHNVHSNFILKINLGLETSCRIPIFNAVCVENFIHCTPFFIFFLFMNAECKS
jgi:hypothetical protein